jgi:hypothetical protein
MKESFKDLDDELLDNNIVVKGSSQKEEKDDG